MDFRHTVRLGKLDAERLSLLAESLAVQSHRLRRQILAIDTVLSAARVVSGGELPDDVIAVGSHAIVQAVNTGESRSIAVVWPEDADPAAGRLSVLSPIGSAVLGRAVGEVVPVETEEGILPLRIAGVFSVPQRMVAESEVE